MKVPTPKKVEENLENREEKEMFYHGLKAKYYLTKVLMEMAIGNSDICIDLPINKGGDFYSCITKKLESKLSPKGWKVWVEDVGYGTLNHCSYLRVNTSGPVPRWLKD